LSLASHASTSARRRRGQKPCRWHPVLGAPQVVERLIPAAAFGKQADR
jgi:hypothetical protein